MTIDGLPDLAMCTIVQNGWKMRVDVDERRAKRERGNYFCTSGYTRDDIRAAVLFADNLSRRDIHRTIISIVLLDSDQHV